MLSGLNKQVKHLSYSIIKCLCGKIIDVDTVIEMELVPTELRFDSNINTDVGNRRKRTGKKKKKNKLFSCIGKLHI